MGKVIPLDAAQDADTLLEAAKGWGLTDVIIVGHDEDGDLCAGANRSLSNAELVLLLERLKRYILELVDNCE